MERANNIGDGRIQVSGLQSEVGGGLTVKVTGLEDKNSSQMGGNKDIQTTAISLCITGLTGFQKMCKGGLGDFSDPRPHPPPSPKSSSPNPSPSPEYFF